MGGSFFDDLCCPLGAGVILLKKRLDGEELDEEELDDDELDDEELDEIGLADEEGDVPSGVLLFLFLDIEDRSFDRRRN